MAVPGADYVLFPDGPERLQKVRQYIAYWNERIGADTSAGGRSVNFGAMTQRLQALEREEQRLAQAIDSGGGSTFARMG